MVGGLASVLSASSEVGLPSDLAPAGESADEPLPPPGELAPSRHRSGRRGWLMRRALLAADAVAFALTVLFLDLTGATISRDPRLLTLGICGFCVWALFAQCYGLYLNDEIQALRPTADDVPGVILLVTLTTWIGILAVAVTEAPTPRLREGAIFWASAIVLLLAGRSAARGIMRTWFAPSERTIIVGAGRVGSEIARKLARRPEYGLEVIGFLDDDPLLDPLRDANEGPPLLGDTTRIEDVLRIYRVERVIVAFSRPRASEQVDLFQRCLQHGVQVDIVPRLYEVIGPRMRVHDIEGLPLVGLPAPRLSRSSWLLKRSLDVVLSIGILVVTSPALAYVAARIKLGSPGPVLFRQQRIGLEGRRFDIIKFRTMYAGADAEKAIVAHLNKHTEDGPRMFKILDDPRVTPFGSFLRRWSIDELPQLWNVLRGEMSLVGPRPLIPAEDENVVGNGRHRLRLTPGITGVWQVLGRSEIPFREMITLDYLYATNWSLWGDMKLLAQTLPRVLRRTGAY